MRTLTPDPGQVLSVAYPGVWSIRAACDEAVAAVTTRGWLDEDLDVVGISMGGLVARTLASGLLNHPRLRIHRLYTIATPHRGARLATYIAPDSAARCMRPGCGFLRDLDTATKHLDMPMYCYVQLQDWWIGTGNAFPEGRGAAWIPPETLYGRTLAHFAINQDPRVRTDIALRLLGEEPLSTGESAPPE